MRLHLRLVRRDHFFPAVLALHRRKQYRLASKLAYTPSLDNSVIEGKDFFLSRKLTYDGCGLGRLDGKTVGLDRGACPGLFGGLVLALDLGRVSRVFLHRST